MRTPCQNVATPMCSRFLVVLLFLQTKPDYGRPAHERARSFVPTLKIRNQSMPSINTMFNVDPLVLDGIKQLKRLLAGTRWGFGEKQNILGNLETLGDPKEVA